MPKKKEPALGADYSSKMKSRYAEKVKTSAKKYSKAHRRENRVVVNMGGRSSTGIFERIGLSGALFMRRCEL
ncbi:MAG: hypothetical protein ACJ0DJ_07965 [bacterium]